MPVTEHVHIHVLNIHKFGEVELSDVHQRGFLEAPRCLEMVMMGKMDWAFQMGPAEFVDRD